MNERHEVMAGNLRLVHGFINRLTKSMVVRLGGYEELFADLTTSYVRAVDYWLASNRKCQLSTYVYITLRCSMRELFRMAVVKLPQKCWHIPAPVGGLDWNWGIAVERDDVVIDDRKRRNLTDVSGEVMKALDFLPPRQAEAIRLYFGIGREKELKLVKVAREMGVSRQGAAQLKDRAMSRLRKLLEDKL